MKPKSLTQCKIVDHVIGLASSKLCFRALMLVPKGVSVIIKKKC